MTTGENEEMLNTRETLAILRISRTTLYKWIEAKKLNPVYSNPNLTKPLLQFKKSEVLALAPKQTND